MVFKNYKTESVFFESILNGIDDEYASLTVSNVWGWYIKCAQRSKMSFYILSIVQIIVSAVIPILVLFKPLVHIDIIIALISTIGAVSGSFLALFHCNENWRRNRESAEKVKEECILCVNALDRYARLEKEARHKLLISNILKIVAKENNKWMIDNKPTEQNKKADGSD